MSRPLDAVVVADNGLETLSASNPLRLQIDGRTATLQVIRNALAHGGQVVPPIDGESGASWESAPKLNGIYLFNALTKAGFATELINDVHREHCRFAALLERSPRAVVISTTFMVSREPLLALIREIKRLCPRTTVIVGGPFVAFSWRIWQRRREAHFAHKKMRQDLLFFNAAGDETDLYIISDTGESLLIQALERLRMGHSFEVLPNTARPVDGAYQFTDRVDDVTTWEEVPIDWAALPDDIFAYGVLPMRASIGCPYLCSFCSFNKDRQLIRVKPLDELVSEMKVVQARGARYVWFADDNFRLGKHDLTKVCERFIAEGLVLKWMTFLRAEVLQAVDPSLLRRAGCIEVQMGIESADETVLTAMRKQANPVLNESVITRLLLAGINCTCYFIIGFPGETEASVNKTISLLNRLEAVDGDGVLSWSFYPFVLVPGSPIFEADQREMYALEGYMHTWRHRTMDSKEARRALLKAFVTLDKSGPIYRGDNLDQLRAMSTGQIRSFIATRHALEKLSLKQAVEPAIVCAAFARIFQRESSMTIEQQVFEQRLAAVATDRQCDAYGDG